MITHRDWLLRKRFFKKVHFNDNGCWEWIGARKEKGYGSFAYDKKNGHAHRYSYTTFIGPIPKGMNVCHHCDNPPCVNPDHLWVGTTQENIDDCIRKGRHVPPPVKNWPALMRKIPHHWQKVDISTVLKIREALKIGGRNQSKIANEFGVSRKTVSRINTGENWAHV